ncbi:hypothetical protein GQR58_007946 [Nymphon striatum]|nr:hypothetical protein GQR58_007946 [Nymphon striatum]
MLQYIKNLFLKLTLTQHSVKLLETDLICVAAPSVHSSFNKFLSHNFLEQCAATKNNKKLPQIVACSIHCPTPISRRWYMLHWELVLSYRMMQYRSSCSKCLDVTSNISNGFEAIISNLRKNIFRGKALKKGLKKKVPKGVSITLLETKLKLMSQKRTHTFENTEIHNSQKPLNSLVTKKSRVAMSVLPHTALKCILLTPHMWLDQLHPLPKLQKHQEKNNFPLQFSGGGTTGLHVAQKVIVSHTLEADPFWDLFRPFLSAFPLEIFFLKLLILNNYERAPLLDLYNLNLKKKLISGPENARHTRKTVQNEIIHTASMSSNKKGVQGTFAEYHGCVLQSLNIVICHACKIKSIQNMMDSCRELYSLFEDSPKRPKRQRAKNEKLKCQFSKDVRAHYELCAVIPTVSVTIMSSESMTELANILQQKWDHVFPVSSAFESELFCWNSYCKRQALGETFVK